MPRFTIKKSVRTSTLSALRRTSIWQYNGYGGKLALTVFRRKCQGTELLTIHSYVPQGYLRVSVMIMPRISGGLGPHIGPFSRRRRPAFRFSRFVGLYCFLSLIGPEYRSRHFSFPSRMAYTRAYMYLQHETPEFFTHEHSTSSLCHTTILLCLQSKSRQTLRTLRHQPVYLISALTTQPPTIL